MIKNKFKDNIKFKDLEKDLEGMTISLSGDREITLTKLIEFAKEEGRKEFVKELYNWVNEYYINQLYSDDFGVISLKTPLVFKNDLLKLLDSLLEEDKCCGLHDPNLCKRDPCCNKCPEEGK